MKQRLCLAQALVHDPAVLLLDEPASGLDPRARLEMRELLKELRVMGKTVVISSHILAELEEFCDGIGIMGNGRLLASGSVGEVGAERLGAIQMRVEILGEPGPALSILDARPDVEVMTPQDEETEAAPTKAIGESHLSIVAFLLEGGPTEQAAILADLIREGVIVSSYGPARARLEDAFMRVTSEDEE